MLLYFVLKKINIKIKNININLLQKILEDDKKLSKGEKFLRKYFLSEVWLDKNNTDKIKKYY